jgi:hypothetical protein
MANHESTPHSSFMSRLLLDGFWFSAGLMAISDWLLGKRGGQKELRNADVRFEASDVSARGVVLTGLGVLVFIYLSIGVLYFVFQHFKNVHAEESPPPLPIAARGVPMPPEPQLQAAPRRELRAFEAAEDFQLKHYSWVDRQKGTVAIPIDRAMDLIVQRGIPAAKGAADQYYHPQAGTRITGFAGKVEPEPR